MPFTVPLTVAGLKDKATHAKNSSITKFNEAKDKYSSPSSSSRSKYASSEDPSSPSGLRPTPPLPARQSTVSSVASPPRTDAFARAPPPPTRDFRSHASASTISANSGWNNKPTAVHDDGDDDEQIDWKNLTPQDKQVFFSWLDEFFERSFNIAVEPRSVHDTVRVHEPPPQQQQVEQIDASPPPPPRPPPRNISSATTGPPSKGLGPPPPVKLSTRPSAPSSASSQTHLPLSLDSSSQFTSYPPPTIHGCSAADAAQYFLPSNTWTDIWFAKDHPLPSHLVGRNDMNWTAAFQWSSIGKTIEVGAMFSDLSLLYYSVSFSKAHPDPLKAVRHAEYLPRPQAWNKDRLVAAHQTYGDIIATYAESFVSSGQFCARGECWDMANEALNHVQQAYPKIPRPVPSQARTHGHLIFESKAMGLGKTVGRWRGGDDRVRRGDIVEWRTVRINTVNAPRGSYCTLGDPEHTAVIVRDSVPRTTPRDGESLDPADLVSLEVVEQSVGKLPSRKEYDMAAFEAGEVWIYRPVGMTAYLGTELKANPPPGLSTVFVV